MAVIFVFNIAFNFVVFNDGSTKELLNLDGTIPVQYKGLIKRFNMPVR